jgi:hypothetical protein
MNASINPVDFMVQRSGLSRAEFAATYDFGRNFLTRVVQGRARGVPSRLSSALWAEWTKKGIDQDDFDELYGTLDVDLAFQRWVTNRRLTNRVKLPDQIPADKKITPFARIVKAIGSVSKTAQTLAVADVAVQRYADGRQRQMPDSIKTALHEMKYPHVSDLESAQERWHKDHA